MSIRPTIEVVRRGEHYSQFPVDAGSGSVDHTAHATGFVAVSDSNNGGTLIPLFCDAEDGLSVDGLCRKLGYRLVPVRKGKRR